MTPEIELFLLWVNGVGQVDILGCEYRLGAALASMREEFDLELLALQGRGRD